MEFVKNVVALVLIVFTAFASYDMAKSEGPLSNADFVVLTVAILIVIGFTDAIRKTLKNGKDSNQESSVSER